MPNLLDDIRVIDWTQAHHGAATGYMLGNLGAMVGGHAPYDYQFVRRTDNERASLAVRGCLTFTATHK